MTMTTIAEIGIAAAFSATQTKVNCGLTPIDSLGQGAPRHHQEDHNTPPAMPALKVKQQHTGPLS